MKIVLPADIRFNALLAVVALALLATAVIGRERPPATEMAQPSAPKAAPQPSVAKDDLDLQRLLRKRSDPSADDLFARPAPIAVVTPAPPPPPAPISQPPAEPPSPPPLPFRYLGQMERQKQPTVLLLNGEDIIMATVGDTVNDLYKIEAIAESNVDFVYLPLAARQSLPIPPLP
jgi:hypothetical protein